MFPAGKKDASDAVEYDGGRNSDSIVAWALDKLAENVLPPDVVEVRMSAGSCFNKPGLVYLHIIIDTSVTLQVRHPRSSSRVDNVIFAWPITASLLQRAAFR